MRYREIQICVPASNYSQILENRTMLEQPWCKRAWMWVEHDPSQGCFPSPPLCLVLPQTSLPSPHALQAAGCLNRVYRTRMQTGKISRVEASDHHESIYFTDEESQLRDLFLWPGWVSALCSGVPDSHAVTQRALSKAAPFRTLTLCLDSW